MSRIPTWLVWFGVIALTMGLRAIYLWSTEPPPALWDAGVYVSCADGVGNCLIHGEGVPDRWNAWWTLGGRLYAFRMLYIRNPLFILLIAPLRAFVPESIAPILLSNVLAEGITTMLLMLLTLKVSESRSVATFGGLLYAVYFPSYCSVIQVVPEAWGACATIFLTYALVRFAQNPSDRKSGLLLCAAIVVAPLMREHLAVAVIVILLWLALARPWRFRDEHSGAAEPANDGPSRRMRVLITLLGLITAGFPILRQVITPASGWKTSFQASYDGWGGRPLRFVPDDWRPAYAPAKELSRRERLLFLSRPAWLAQAAERSILAWSRPDDILRRTWLVFSRGFQHDYHRLLWLSALGFLPLALLRHRWHVIIVVVLIGITLPVGAGGRPETRYNILGMPLVVVLASEMLSLTCWELVRSIRTRQWRFTFLVALFLALLAYAAHSPSPPGIARMAHGPLYLLSRVVFACAFLVFPSTLLLREWKNRRLQGTPFYLNAVLLGVFAALFLTAAVRQPLWREMHFRFDDRLSAISTIAIEQPRVLTTSELRAAWIVMDLAFEHPRTATLSVTAKNGTRRATALDSRSLAGELPFGPHHPKVDLRRLEMRGQTVAEVPKWIYVPVDFAFISDVFTSLGYSYRLDCQGKGQIGADFVGRDLAFQLPAVEPFAQSIYRYFCVGDYRAPRLYQVNSHHRSTIQGDPTLARPRIYLVILLNSGEVIVR